MTESGEDAVHLASNLIKFAYVRMEARARRAEVQTWIRNARPDILMIRCEENDTAKVWGANFQPEEMHQFQGGGVHGPRNL